MLQDVVVVDRANEQLQNTLISHLQELDSVFIYLSFSLKRLSIYDYFCFIYKCYE